MSDPAVSPVAVWPHRLAVLMAVVTFPLLWVGGLVTTYRAGMAVPDWPNTYGYNLLLYPWQTWLLGPWDLLIEHGHRLLGALVGMLTIGFFIAVWRTVPRGSAWRWLAVAALLGVCLQGSLGGLRVLLDRVQLARLHGCLGPLFFALACALATLSSRRWLVEASPFARQTWAASASGAAVLQRRALLTVVLAYAQLVAGAHLRHLPVGAAPAAFQITLMVHLFLAAAVAVHAVLIVVAARRLPLAAGAQRRWAWRLAALVAMQILVGASTWIVRYNWPAWLPERAWSSGLTIVAESPLQATVVTAHVALGSLILAAATVASLWSWRLSQTCSAARLGEPVAGRSSSSLLRYSTGCDIAWMRCQNSDVSRCFASGEVEKCQEGIFQRTASGGAGQLRLQLAEALG